MQFNENNKSTQEPEDVRSEYAAIVDYHGSLVNSRFTIAGLYMAALGFTANAVLGKDASWGACAAGAFLAFWLTLCVWILELRSRALYTNLAHRGIEIEHRNWGLRGPLWYSGFFSRQYNEKPTQNEDEENVPTRPGLDSPKIAWRKKAISQPHARYISHSWGFDLLYGGSMAFWLITLIVSLYFVALERIPDARADCGRLERGLPIGEHDHVPWREIR